MSSNHAKIWVHRRHEAFPDVGLEFQIVPLAVAAALIKARCAQDWQTDGKHLKKVEPDVVVRKPGRKPETSKAEPPEKEETPPSPPPLAPRPAVPKKKVLTRRAYKRRDMRPES